MKKVVQHILGWFGYRITKKSDFDYDLLPEANNLERHMINVSGKYSMGNNVRMWALLQSVYHIHNAKIDGDIVECGVWEGGNIMLAALACAHLGMKRQLWAYDTFEGMSEPTNFDTNIHDAQASAKWLTSNKGSNWCSSSLDRVRLNLSSVLGDVGNINFIKGKVEDTLNIATNVPEHISILRLDTDFYESTKKELEVLYPKLVSGGILIIDDYGHWKGARKAVDEYFRGTNIWFHRIDYSARLVIKP